MINYEEREIMLDDSVDDRVRLIDFITANIGALSEPEILNLENLGLGETVRLGKIQVRRVS